MTPRSSTDARVAVGPVGCSPHGGVVGRDHLRAYLRHRPANGAFGTGWILRQPSPGLPEALLALAEADGAYQASDTTSSGWRQLALVTPGVRRGELRAPHPDNPGNNATCYAIP